MLRSFQVDWQVVLLLAQLEKVLGFEREMKRAQIALLVHIKNKLTPEQQAKLEDIRSKTQHYSTVFSPAQCRDLSPRR